MIVLLIFIICDFFLGIDLTQNFNNIQNRFTDKKFITDILCLDLIERYSESSLMDFKLQQDCDKVCEREYGKDYVSYHGTKQIECLEGENLTCLCYKLNSN